MIIHEDMVKMLMDHPFLETMEDRHIEILASVAYTENFQVGDYLFRAGESAESCFLIRTGVVGIELYDPQRGAVTVERLIDGRVVGLSWVVPPHMWCFDGKALRDTQVISFPAEKLRRACDEDPEFGYTMLKLFSVVFSERLHATRRQLLDANR